MSKNLIVVKSNDLVEASYRLTLDEMRVLLLTIGKIDPKTKDHYRDFEFTVAEFAERFNTDEKSAYKQVQNAVDKLGGRWALVESTPKYDRKVTFLTQQIYFKSEGRFKIILHEDLLPFVCEIKGKFTQYSLEYISKFSGFHSIRLYEILAQYKSTGWREVTLKDLKDWLQVADKYNRYNNFKQWVLDPSLKEINEKSDLFIKVDTIKRGRSIHALHFKIKQKNIDIIDKGKRKIFGVFVETNRPAVAKNSHEEGVWATENYNNAIKEIRRQGFIKGRFVDEELKIIPTEWLNVLVKYARIINKYLARDISDELSKRQKQLNIADL